MNFTAAAGMTPNRLNFVGRPSLNEEQLIKNEKEKLEKEKQLLAAKQKREKQLLAAKQKRLAAKEKLLERKWVKTILGYLLTIGLRRWVRGSDGPKNLFSPNSACSMYF